MQLFVKGLQGTYTLEVSPALTVQELKSAVENVSFIPADFQRLVCASRQLVAGQVGDLLEEADTIQMLFDINGGMRAKWRKKRMRRLRRKRRKMRQRAR